jgi:phage-related protein
MWLPRWLMRMKPPFVRRRRHRRLRRPAAPGSRREFDGGHHRRLKALRQVLAAMREVALLGLRAARHLVGDLYEVRADGEHEAFRILFGPEGRRGQVLLALEGFSKKTQKTRPATIRLAQRRLADWGSRGVL